MSDNEIGKKLYERRKALGLTLEEVGKAVGVGKSTVRKWENGMIKNMGSDKISALARVLQMNPVEIVPMDQPETQEPVKDFSEILRQTGIAYKIGFAPEKLNIPRFDRLAFMEEDEKQLIKHWRSADDNIKSAVRKLLDMDEQNGKVES